MSISECWYVCMSSMYLGEMHVSMHVWVYVSVCTCECVGMYVCMNVCVCYVERDGCSCGVIALGSWWPAGLVRWPLTVSSHLYNWSNEVHRRHETKLEIRKHGCNSNSSTWCQWPWERPSTSLGLVFQSAWWSLQLDNGKLIADTQD